MQIGVACSFEETFRFVVIKWASRVILDAQNDRCRPNVMGYLFLKEGCSYELSAIARLKVYCYFLRSVETD